MLNFGFLVRQVSAQQARSLVTPLLEGHQASLAVCAAYRDFLRVSQDSPLLQREYVLSQNLHQKGMAPALVREYVEANLATLSGHSLGELQEAHQRLAPLLTEASGEPTALEGAIQTLVCETLTPVNQRHVNRYYDALQLVTESLCETGAVEVPLTESEFTLEEVLQGAVKPLAENLERLSEGDREFLLVAMGSDEAARQQLYETYCAQAQELLAEHAGTSAYERLQRMRYDPATATEELLDLHQLLRPEH